MNGQQKTNPPNQTILGDYHCCEDISLTMQPGHCKVDLNIRSPMFDSNSIFSAKILNKEESFLSASQENSYKVSKTICPTLFQNRPSFLNPVSLMHPGDQACDVKELTSTISSPGEASCNNSLCDDLAVRHDSCSASASLFISKKKLHPRDSSLCKERKEVEANLRHEGLTHSPDALEKVPPYSSVDEKLHSTSMPRITRVIVSGNDLPPYSRKPKHQMSFDEYWKSVSIEKSRIVTPILKKNSISRLGKGCNQNYQPSNLKTKKLKFATKDVVFIYDPEN